MKFEELLFKPESKHKYFIVDCMNNVVGNKKGYLTYSGTNRALSSRVKTPDGLKVLRHVLWDTYDIERELGYTDTLIYQVKFVK